MINQDQFGYKAGYYHYCKHLVKQGHKITYLCNDHGLPKMNIDGIRVIYVKESSSIKWRKIFLSKIKELKAEETIDIALCSYFRGCSILKTISKGLPIVIDVRSGDLSKNEIKRKLYNRIIKFEASLFSHIMILSGSLAKLLKLKEGSYDVVPLGADEISDASRQYEAIKISSSKGSFQVLIESRYLNCLHYDSYVNCTDIQKISSEQCKTVLGRLNSQFMDIVKRQVQSAMNRFYSQMDDFIDKDYKYTESYWDNPNRSDILHIINTITSRLPNCDFIWKKFCFCHIFWIRRI